MSLESSPMTVKRKMPFIPNNHSVWEISYRGVDTQTEDEIRAIVSAHYAEYISAIDTTEQVDEAEINSNNFKITGVKDIERVTYLLRRISKKRDEEGLRTIFSLMEDVEVRGVRLPHIERSHNQPFVSDDRYHYVLFDFIDANHYRGTLAELVSAASVLGSLDSTLKEITPTYRDREVFVFSQEYKSQRTFSEEMWEEIFSAAEAHRKNEEEGGVADRLLSRKDEVLRFVEEASDIGSTTPEMQLVHFDLHPHNFLADGTEIVAVLDFDSIRYLEKMRAFAFAFHRLIRQHIIATAPEDTEAALQYVKKVFIEEYRKQGTLSDEELALIPAFIKNESIARLTTAMKEYAATGVLAWKTDLEKQLTNCNEADRFQVSL